MIRIAAICLIGTIAASCGLSEIGVHPRASADIGWLNPGTASLNASYFVTGFDYPDDYNWRADPEKGDIKCSLVVYADNIPMMKIPVGDAYKVSADPDMHRIIDGHLYTDFSSGSETIIKKDGKEILRYEGQEMILDMAICAEDTYTLGQMRGGTGFIWRKNGKKLLERKRGYAFGRMSMENGNVDLAFCEPVLHAEEEVERYYHARNGVVTQIALREDVKKVWDVLTVGGQVIYLASLIGIDSPVLVRSDTLSIMKTPDGATLLSSRLFSEGNTIWTDALYSSGGKEFSIIWCNGEIYATFAPDGVVSSTASWEDGVCCATNAADDKSRGKIFRNGEIFPMPAEYSAIGEKAMTVVDGILHVGLSSLSGQKPLVWKDKRIDTLDFNGYIASVTMY